MSKDRLEELLEAMPRIAEAVNRFDSPDVQRAAFDAIVKTAVGDTVPEPRSHQHAAQPERSGAEASPTRTQQEPQEGKPGASNGKAPTKKPGRKGKLAAPPLDQTIDIKPNGKISLPEFADQKQPGNMQDRSMVIVYWLKHHSDCAQIGPSQTYTCYRKMGWKAPTNLRNQLQYIASAKGWLDTSDTEDISLTIAGEQYVDHDLPISPTK